MTAPAGLCGSCGTPMQWSFIHGDLVVRCDTCIDFFAVDSGTEGAGVDHRERREAVMPDGRPIRCIERIVQDASFNADCEVL